jgi:hypothetical protein
MAKVASRPAEVPRASYTVSEFCVAHRISESFYYKIRLLGLGPRERRTLGKVTISFEAAAEWRNMEREAKDRASAAAPE